MDDPTPVRRIPDGASVEHFGMTWTVTALENGDTYRLARTTDEGRPYTGRLPRTYLESTNPDALEEVTDAR